MTTGEIALMNRATGVVQASNGREIIASVAPNPSHLQAAVARQLSAWESAAAKGKQLKDVLGRYEESSAQPAKNPVYDLLSGEHRVYSLVSRAGAENAVEIGCVENGSRDDPLGSVKVLRDVGPRRELRQAEMKVFFVSG